MPIEQRTLVLSGLADLQKAWHVADRETSKELKQALRDAAEPVRSDAQRLAAGRITHLAAGDPWARMRTGVTRKSVYVAPKQRGTRVRSRRRRKFGDLLADRAMQPALNKNVREVEERVDDALRTVGRKWENA